MNTARKILSLDQAAEVCSRLRTEGKRVVQYHGAFDSVHVGHVALFEEARKLGDVLFVTVAHAGKGGENSSQIFAKWLAAIERVDYVIITPTCSSTEVIECLRPHIYCKETGYSDTANDVAGNIQDDVTAVRRCGGEIVRLGPAVSGVTRLNGQSFTSHSSEVKTFSRQIAETCSPAEFHRMVDEFENLRILIVGDIIFDRYTTVEIQGLTSKNSILSGRYVDEQIQAGGALAVYRHIREFSPHVKLIGLVGNEPWLENTLGKFIPSADEDIVRSSKFTTVVKQRYIGPRAEGKELNKIFSVNFIEKHHPDDEAHRAVIDRIAANIDDCDLVIAMDFGHGVMADTVRDYVQNKARFLAVNCQTNSYNHGFNILNRRYHRADAFSLDQTEITLAVGRREFDARHELGSLGQSLMSKYAWLTRGASETLGWRPNGDLAACAALECTVVDTLGAGDAFCSVAFLAAARGLPMNTATFMGQLAGAQAVKIVGNAEPIRKDRFLEAAAKMLAL